MQTYIFNLYVHKFNPSCISLQKINFLDCGTVSRQNINFCTNQLSSTTCKIEILEEP